MPLSLSLCLSRALAPLRLGRVRVLPLQRALSDGVSSVVTRLNSMFALLSLFWPNLRNGCTYKLRGAHE